MKENRLIGQNGHGSHGCSRPTVVEHTLLAENRIVNGKMEILMVNHRLNKYTFERKPLYQYLLLIHQIYVIELIIWGDYFIGYQLVLLS